MTRDEWLAALPAPNDPLLPWVIQGIPLWDDAAAMGNALKYEAWAALNYDLPRSARLARALITLGEHTEQETLVALGEMALGDALRLQRRLDEGYEWLDQAAARFERLGDALGWARTRIGWLGHIHTRRGTPALEPIVQRAATIFERHECWAWLSTLCYQYARYWQVRGQRPEQLHWCLRALRAAERIEDEEAAFRPFALSLIMLVAVRSFLGHYDEAQAALAQLLDLFQGERATGYLYVEFLNQAGHFYLMTGRYTQALYYLYEAERRAEREEHQIYTTWWFAHVYRHLGRLQESMALLTSLLERLAERPDWALVECDARLLLSDVLAAQERWQAALDVLEPGITKMQEALPEMSSFWFSEAYQQQARLLHRLGQRDRLPHLLEQALRLAEESRQEYALAEVHLLMAEVATTAQARELALSRALESCTHIPWVRWRVHHLAAMLADTPAQRQHRLEQAVTDLDTVQSSLAASFHADYLSKTEALYHALIASYLEQGNSALAWQTLERAKSRALINSLMVQREAKGQAQTPLAAELEQLQTRHYTLVQARLQGHASWEEVRRIEEEMESLQEALEVEMLGRREPLGVPPPILPEAPPGSDLVGFYLVGEEAHAFVHNGQALHHLRLPTTPEELNGLVSALFINMRSVPTVPEPWVPPLTLQLHRVLEKLDSVLLAPLRPLLRHERLVLVPHGPLHQLPFHLLRAENRYLLERCESRLVPTARLVRREELPPQRAGQQQHVVVSHSWEGRLQQAVAEGRMVAEILGGATLLEGHAATREALMALMPGASVLHIAAHGAHRADAPHFSHIHLEDGLLNAADLFFLSLRASLVTLSACDTGQAQVRAGDDPAGLWRGFLAAGARSLLVSLWQLEDESALSLMRDFYQTLMRAVPKVAALRSVQQAWLASAEGRFAHPFYWGAYQLIGDDGPLHC